MKYNIKNSFLLFFLLFCFVVQTGLAQSIHSGTINFDRGWKFTGIEFKQDSGRNIGKDHLGGKNWNDQFAIEKVDINDSSLLPENFNLQKELSRLKGHTWTKVTLPHIAFSEPVPVIHPREGLAYYKKEFIVPSSLKGKKITIEFEGAMQIAEVWFNGKFVKRHLGGYLPFTVDITKIANYGKANTIFVKLDNRANPLVPPGKPVEDLDFLYYSGIY
ncbi:MAG: sugar-binding domain-containing protein, partial [Chitinophagaceae bacterium]